MTNTAAHSGHVLRLLIVDDEPLARLRLETLLKDMQLPVAIELAGQAESAMQALDLAKSVRPDAMLLDIHMPAIDGMTLAHEMRRQHPYCQLIFVTAHSEHALHAFEVAATDYLTKPVRRERLHNALLKVLAQRSLQQNMPLANTPPTVGKQESLLIQDRERSQRLPLSEILYAKAENKYIILHTIHKHEWIWEGSLNMLEEKYPQHFLRIHRNTLVQRHMLRQIKHCIQADGSEGWLLQLVGSSEWLPVSRRQLPLVRQALQAL